MADTATGNITGRMIALDETRAVFVGTSQNDDGLTYIKFVNSEGEETRLKISLDARLALVALLSLRTHFVHTEGGEWVAVSGEGT